MIRLSRIFVIFAIGLLGNYTQAQSTKLCAEFFSEGHKIRFAVGPFSIAHDGRDVFPHNLSKYVSVGGVQNSIVFEGWRVLSNGDVIPHSWTALEISAIVGKQLDSSELASVVRIHQIGEGEAGKDGSAAGIYNYTPSQLRAKWEQAKLELPTLDNGAIRRLFRNGVFGFFGPRNGSKRKHLLNLGNNRYFPVFERSVMKGTFANGGVETTTSTILSYNKNVIYAGYQAIKMEIETVRTGESVVDGANVYRTTTYTRVVADTIYTANEGQPWELAWKLPENTVTFRRSDQEGTYKWNYVGDWISPETGIKYVDAYKLTYSESRYAAIYVPQLGIIRHELPGIFTFTSE